MENYIFILTSPLIKMPIIGHITPFGIIALMGISYIISLQIEASATTKQG